MQLQLSLFFIFLVNFFNINPINIINQDNLSNYEDVYETNNNVDDAVDLLDPTTGLIEDNYYEIDSYEISFDATLDAITGYCDLDYYYITTLTDSNVTININSDDGNPIYEFIVFKENYEWTESGTLFQVREELYSNFSSSFSEYSFLATPGTYFIYVGGNQTTSVGYNIEISTRKTYDSPDAHVGDMKYNKELLGAVWISDLVPANVLSNGQANFTNLFSYYKEANSNISTKDDALIDLMNIANGEPIHLASYYIWDPYLRYVYYQIVSMLHEELETILKEEEIIAENIEVTYEFVSDVTDGLVKGINLILNGVPYYIKFLVKCQMWLIQNNIAYFFELIKPEPDYETTFYLSFLSELKETFNMNIGTIDSDTNESLTDEQICNFLDNYDLFEIIEIPIYYSLGVNNSIFNNYDEYYISFYDAMSSCSFIDNFNYEGRYIYSNNINNFYCRGKVYGIQEYNDIGNISNLTEISEIPDIMPQPEEVPLNLEQDVDEIPEFSYVWLSFEVPETNEYYFLFKGDGNFNRKVEIFDEVVSGYSYEGLMESNVGGYSSEYEEDEGSYFRITLNEDDVIYIRLSGGSFSGVAESSIFKISTEPTNGASHIHSYETCEQYNGNQHVYLCDCGDMIYENHIVRTTSNRCIVCGCIVDKGIVQWGVNSMLLKTSNGSIMLPNGIIILVDEDLENYYNGTLYFKKEGLETATS